MDERSSAHASDSLNPETGGGGDAASRTPDGGSTGADTKSPAPVTPAPAEANDAKTEQGAAPASPKTPKLRVQRRQQPKLRQLLPAWGVSLIIHVVVLTALAAATFTAEDIIKPLSFDSALTYAMGEPEEAPIYADVADIPRDQAVGNEHTGVTEPSEEEEARESSVISAGTPSATPRIRGTGKGKITEENSLPGGLKIEGLNHSPLQLLPGAPAMDLYGGGMIAGDPTNQIEGIGEALDQLAREILRHLRDHKLTVAWLFDESISMQDDHKTIQEKFDRVSSELKKHIDPSKKSAGALNHVIIGFGETSELGTKKPTLDADEVGRSIRKLKTDMTGIENTMTAIRDTVEACAGLLGKDRRMLLVLVTDESGDDGAFVEEARQALKKHNVPLYVIGRQSLFGYPFAHHQYQDPVTKDVYHPLIRRGPETADLEIFQWDGLYERWDEQPSGFAPWELARLASDSGGIYFLLPSEEFMRVRQREKAYSSAQLKEYRPEYGNRMVYVQNRTESELRRTLYTIVTETKSMIYRREYPTNTAELVQLAAQEGDKATEKLNILLQVQERLESLKSHRDREPEKRWQAHYDLILAQTVAFQVKAYEYRALMAQMIKSPPAPSRSLKPDEALTYVVNHSGTPVASKDETAKKYAEAKKLLEEVIARHPNTPWADLAKDTINRGFSVQLDEWFHSTQYNERAKYVPKY